MSKNDPDKTSMVLINLSEQFGGPYMADPVGNGDYILSNTEGRHFEGTLRQGFVLGVARLAKEGDQGMAHQMLRSKVRGIGLNA